MALTNFQESIILFIHDAKTPTRLEIARHFNCGPEIKGSRRIDSDFQIIEPFTKFDKNSGDYWGTAIKLNDNGTIIAESLKSKADKEAQAKSEKQANDKKEDRRWWITTIIAVVALFIAILK